MTGDFAAKIVFLISALVSGYVAVSVYGAVIEFAAGVLSALP